MGTTAGQTTYGDAPRSARAGQRAVPKMRPSDPNVGERPRGADSGDDRDAWSVTQRAERARRDPYHPQPSSQRRDPRGAHATGSIPGRDRVILMPPTTRMPIGCDRRQRSAAAVEHDRSGPSSSAILVPARTFESDRAGEPPPHRLQPTVGSPVEAAVSRWSDAAWRPARESSRRMATAGWTSITSGSAGSPRRSRRR